MRPISAKTGLCLAASTSEGIDWLVEHDSHGQLLALIADYYRFTADEEFLEESWTFVDKAVGCIERLLGEDGLLPISVSHEGYLAQPVHSYWDDFWALRGLRDAVDLAQALGRHDAAQHWQALATRFASSLFVSIEATRAQRKLDFIPGSIEWADFDPTATANALYLHDVPEGWTARQSIEPSISISPTGMISAAAPWHRRATRPMKSASSAHWCAWAARCGSGAAEVLSVGSPPAALESVAGDRVARPYRRLPISAIFRTPGLPPNTFSPCADSSPTSAKPINAWYSQPALRPNGSRVPVLQVHKMPTLYGSLSYSLRRIGFANAAIRDRQRDRRQAGSAPAAGGRRCAA